MGRRETGPEGGVGVGVGGDARDARRPQEPRVEEPLAEALARRAALSTSTYECLAVL